MHWWLVGCGILGGSIKVWCIPRSIEMIAPSNDPSIWLFVCWTQKRMLICSTHFSQFCRVFQLLRHKFPTPDTNWHTVRTDWRSQQCQCARKSNNCLLILNFFLYLIHLYTFFSLILSEDSTCKYAKRYIFSIEAKRRDKHFCDNTIQKNCTYAKEIWNRTKGSVFRRI